MSKSLNPLARIQSVDLLRGIVIVIMALDHVRDFWSPTAYDPTDLTETSPELFFTRWVTHFCAPVFVFLSGSSAWLHAASRNATSTELAQFLFTRGLWLVFIEIVVINPAWFFEPGWTLLSGFLLLQVIWALGWGMIFLAGLIFLPNIAIAIIGFAMVFGHNFYDGMMPGQWGEFSWFWRYLHVSSYEQVFPNLGLVFAYPVIPWIGVMALGYLFGAVLQKPAAERDRLCVKIGVSAVLIFLVLRGFNIYGDPVPWGTQDRGSLFTFLSFLNVQKYPPSLLYLLITLGPPIAFLPILEKVKGKLVDIFIIYGRVPFFFYILHLYLIHITASVWVFMTFGFWGNSLTWGWGLANVPDAYSPSLLRTYVAWVLTMLVLYWPCKWFVGIRKRHKQWWLSYL